MNRQRGKGFLCNIISELIFTCDNASNARVIASCHGLTNNIKLGESNRIHFINVLNESILIDNRENSSVY